jgi:hypothetical protein
MAHWNVCVCVCVHTYDMYVCSMYVCMYVHFKHPQYTWQKSNYRDAELHEVVHRFNQGAHYLQNAFSWYPLKCNLSTPMRKIWPALHWFSWKWYMIISIMCTILLKYFTHITEYTYKLWMCHCTAWLLMNIIITPYVFCLQLLCCILPKLDEKYIKYGQNFSMPWSKVLLSLHQFLHTSPMVNSIVWKSSVPNCTMGRDSSQYKDFFGLDSPCIKSQWESGFLWTKLMVLYSPHPNCKKVKVTQQQADVAQGVPGRLRTRIFLMFGTTRVVGHQPYASATFVPGEIPGTHFQGLSQPQGTWFPRVEPWKKSPVTPLGIDPGTVRLAAQCLNHYTTPGPPNCKNSRKQSFELYSKNLHLNVTKNQS